MEFITPQLWRDNECNSKVSENSLQKMQQKVRRSVSRHKEKTNAARGVSHRRTRGLSSPHAGFAISLCGVHYPRTRNLAEKHAPFGHSAQGTCTFFSLCLKTCPCKMLIPRCGSI